MLHRRFFIIIIKFIFILLNFIFFLFGDLNVDFAYMIHTMEWKQVLTKISLNIFMHVVTELFILYIYYGYTNINLSGLAIKHVDCRS